MSLPLAQELTEYITFKTVSGTLNASTGKASSSVTYANAYARIEEMGGTIDEPPDQQHQSETHNYEIITQYLSGVTAFMEIAWGSKTLVITDAPQKQFDRNNRQWLIIHASETLESDV